MKTPLFWYDTTPPKWQKILEPLEGLYNILRRKNLETTQKTIDIPVISIGNITAGGTGKTPTSIMLNDLIQTHQIALSPFFITRGYGGTISKAEMVSNDTAPYMCGEEALLLAEHAPTIVAPNRFEGAIYAKELGADIVILDDGLQNKTLKPSLSFCVIDGNYGFGNGRMIPLGALREPMIEAFKRIDAVILIGDDRRNVISQIPSNIPIFKAFIEANTSHIKPDTNYFAVCGIGLPHKFLETLKTLNISVAGHEFFADHYPYTIMDIKRLLLRAKKNHARIITTSKDFIKIKSITSDLSLIDVLPITIKCDNEETLIQFLKNRIEKSS